MSIFEYRLQLRLIFQVCSQRYKPLQDGCITFSLASFFLNASEKKKKFAGSSFGLVLFAITLHTLPRALAPPY